MANNKKHAVTMSCAHCGTEFQDRSSGLQRRYCSHACKQAARVDRDRSNAEVVRARARAWYHERGGKERVAERNRRPEVTAYRRLQVRLYKARHPNKVAEWTTDYRSRRNQRVAAQSDGTAGRMISALMKLATCQYCGHRFASDSEKRIDHRHPISRGGPHSAVNLEICCEQCNSTKRDMPFINWVVRLNEPWKTKALARAEKANNGPIDQPQLFLDAKPLNRRPSKTQIEKASERMVNANARQAWEYWLYQRATNEWLDGYYSHHQKPWTDHRLTRAQAFFVRYKNDREFARRWNDRRNERRKSQRAARKRVLENDGVVLP